MPRPRKADPDRECRNCSLALARKRFNGTLEDLTAFRKRHYCDRACMAAHMEGIIKVPNPRNSRRQAKKMRAEACWLCGTTEGQISAHHADDDPMNNDPANVVTLCQSCHMKTHWRQWKASSPPSSSR